MKKRPGMALFLKKLKCCVYHFLNEKMGDFYIGYLALF